MPDLLAQQNNNLIYKSESYNIVGSAMEVHRHLGPGFLENVYQEALETEFIERKIPYKKEFELPINYKGKTLEKNILPTLSATTK